jgi:TonB family protein
MPFALRGSWTRRDGPRFAAAAGVSLACHVLFALVLAGISTSPVSRPRPIVVTMLERGGGGSAGGAAAAAEAASAEPAREPARLAAIVAPVPAAAPLRPARPVVAPSRPRTAPARKGPAAAPDVPPAAPPTNAGSDGLGSSSAGGVESGAADVGGPGDGRGAGGGGLRAFCRSCPAPAYPSRARRQGWQGTVEVGLRVAADGSVESAAVERSSGYPTLDDVALASARASRFAVPTGGSRLEGRLRYRFVLDATAAER